MLPEELRAELQRLGHLKDPKARRIAERVRMRSCGPCRACCTIKGVDDLDPPKPANTPCASLCARGCSRYATRPESCRTYLCAWRLGLGGSEARPDRSGVVVDLVSMSESAGVEADFDGGLTVRCGGKPFEVGPVWDLISDALALGPFYVAMVDPEGDLVPSTARFDPEPAKVAARLAYMATTGRAPAGSWKAKPRQES